MCIRLYGVSLYGFKGQFIVNADATRAEQSRERIWHTREQLDADETQQKVKFFSSRFLRLRCVCVYYELAFRLNIHMPFGTVELCKVRAVRPA